MIYRALGKTTLNASRIGLGCVTFGREIDQAESFTILDHAVDCGINLLDTAEAYGGGQSRRARRDQTGIDQPLEKTDELHSSELILGQWFKSRGLRDKVILQTKVLPPLSKQRILDSIDASLARLRTDYIDLFMFHAFDQQTPISQSIEAMEIAVRAGKVRFVGCSNFSADQVRLCGNATLKIAQLNYNLTVRDAEESLMPFCQREGIGIQTYSPLGAGFLTGKYDRRAASPPCGSRFDLLPAHRDIYFHEDNFELVNRLSRLAAREGISAANIALAWVLKHRIVDCVLVGARTRGHIDQAVESLNVRFDPAWEAELFDSRFQVISRKEVSTC
jgi:aryl-alcohol dehydrogenase-like predicted oxidoreductase